MKDLPSRVLMVVTGIGNGFVEAWVSVLERAGSQVVVLDNSHKASLEDAPASLLAQTVFVHPAGGAEGQWRNAVEDLLGGPPEMLFYWWGLDSLRQREPIETWRVPVVLCVDTYPNASIAASEFREYLRGFALVGGIDGLVVPSDEMRSMLVRRYPMLRPVPSVVVVSPYGQAAHFAANPAFGSSERVRLKFLGRSDYFYSDSTRMGKDDLGPWLSGFLERGVEVHVQAPSQQAQRQILSERGYIFYQPLERKTLMDGRFAAALEPFHGNLVYYSVRNSTIARRVANGLSTRFANAVCAPTPLVVPPEATFASRFLDEMGTGIAKRDHDTIIEKLLSDGDDMRRAWHDRHASWAAETVAEAFVAFLVRVTARR